MGFIISKEFPSRFLSGDEVGEKFLDLTIRETKKEMAYSPKTQKKEPVLVVYFEGHVRGIRLGKERAIELRNIMQNDDTDAWKGKKVQVYAEKKFCFGKDNQVLHFRVSKSALSKELDQIATSQS